MGGPETSFFLRCHHQDVIPQLDKMKVEARKNAEANFKWSKSSDAAWRFRTSGELLVFSCPSKIEHIPIPIMCIPPTKP